MLLFWLIAAALIGIGLAFILPTLLQRVPTAPRDAKRQANVAVYRDQISELQRDLENGLIGHDQFEQDRDDIERRLLDDVAFTGVAKQEKASSGSVRATYAIAVIIPIAAVGLYLLIGKPSALSGAPPPAMANGQMTQAGIEANVAALAKRLEQNPNDADGWTMLGRSYLNLEKYKEASEAYAKATSLKTTDADLLTEYAFVLAMNNGRQLQGRPMELIQQALKIAPENPKTLELAGTAEFQAKNYEQAIAYWNKVLAKSPPNSELSNSVLEHINEAKALAGDKSK